MCKTAPCKNYFNTGFISIEAWAILQIRLDEILQVKLLLILAIWQCRSM